MKILLIADVEEKGLWDYYSPDKTKGVDLIISCGDLSAEYLEFLNTVVNVPLLYVRGNHDSSYDEREPLGCDDIDDELYLFHGLRIVGLGGSVRYRSGSDMYTEEEMEKRIRKLEKLIRYTDGFDLLVSHAPARGCGDLDDPAHRGFECFNRLLETWHPQYMVHGHVHQSYVNDFKRARKHPSGTTIINACGHCFLEIDPQSDSFLKKRKTLHDIAMQKRLKGQIS